VVEHDNVAPFGELVNRTDSKPASEWVSQRRSRSFPAARDWRAASSSATLSVDDPN